MRRLDFYVAAALSSGQFNGQQAVEEAEAACEALNTDPDGRIYLIDEPTVHIMFENELGIDGMIGANLTTKQTHLDHMVHFHNDLG